MEDRITIASANLNGPTSQPDSGMPIGEALDRRRKLLELEISHFTALKEEEFRDYERELQLVHKQEEGKPILNPSRTDDVTAPGSGTSDDVAGLIQGAINGNKVLGLHDDFVRHCHDQANETNVGLSGTMDKEHLDVKTHQLGPRSPTSSFERRLGFRDLFPPNYLPLLDIPPQHSRQHGSSSLSLSSPQEPDLPSHPRVTDTQLSSSATLPATSFSSLHSPPQNNSFSASVPRPTILQGRRPSSRSDMSITSLRSSLRQSKTPKSPKHVLFSIDNLVLSPGTSPVLQRKGGVAPIPFSGLVDMPKEVKQTIVMDDIDGNMLDADDATSGVSEQIEDIGVSSDLINAGFTKSQNKSLASTMASPSLGLSYHQLVEPVDLTYKVDGDEFEQVERDDDTLFSFDEDVDLDDLGDAGDEKDADEADMDNSRAETILKSSPHAGSLPIEIKWPARKDPRD